MRRDTEEVDISARFTCEWVDKGYVLSMTGQTSIIRK